jgi:hypothetical protein
MVITASALRSDIYRLLDVVAETGKGLTVERKGKLLKIVPVGKQGKLARLTPHACVSGDPEDLIHIDWSEEWSGGVEP